MKIIGSSPKRHINACVGRDINLQVPTGELIVTQNQLCEGGESAQPDRQLSFQVITG